jgi:fatty-acyl-CoA synthase
MLQWPDSTLWNGFVDVASRRRDHPVIKFRGETWSYLETKQAGEALAHGFADEGIRAGDTIAVWLGNRPAFLLTQLAAAYLGAVVVPINTRYRSHEVEYMLSDADCVAVVTERELLGNDYLALLADVIPGIETPDKTFEAIPSLRSVITVGEADEYPPVREFDNVLETGQGREKLDPATDPTDPAAIFYTSGTTGEPKGCLQSHRSLLNHSFQVGEHLGVNDNDIAYTALPVYGIWGFNVVVSAISQGMTLVMQTHFEPERALRAFDEQNVTYCSILATQLYRMAELNEFDPGAFSQFRRATIAFTSSKFTPEKFRELQEVFGFPPVRAYGLSEANSQVVVGDPEASIEERLELGGPICHPDEEARIVDPETGKECEQGEVGEIHLRGFNLFSEYLGKPEQTEAAMEGGWFHTGDLGRRTADDRYVFESRVDDALRVRGFLVVPDEIETAIDDLPGVDQSQVVGVPHPRHGQVPVAFVKRAESNVDEAELIASLEQRIADYKTPETVRFVESFPRSDGPHGAKIKKTELQERVVDLYE